MCSDAFGSIRKFLEASGNFFFQFVSIFKNFSYLSEIPIMNLAFIAVE